MVGSDTDLDYLDRAARHFEGMAQIKREGEPYHADPGHPINGGREFETYGIPMSKFVLDTQGAYYGGGGSAGASPGYGSGGGNGGCYVASYPPVPQIKQPEAITATEALQAPELNEANLAQLLTDLGRIYPGGAKIRMGKAELEAQLAVYQAAKDCEANKAAAEHFRLAAEEAIKQANERFQQYVDANERAIDLQTQLDMQTAETLSCLERIKELEAQLGQKAENKPNTRDMSRLGHFGESHAKNGLSLFDRYY